MQELDTRTFPEIWAQLGGQQKEDVTRALMLEGCTYVRQTIWNWATGKTSPANLAMKRAISSAVNKALNIRTNGQTLFPPKSRK